MSTKKKIITIIIGVEAVIIAAVIVFLVYMNSDTVKVSRQLELAQRYLLEEDYEQAIAAFEIVIETDPKNVDAYLGLAEAYAATDDLENAVKILEKASKKTDSEEVLAMLEIHNAEMEQRELAAQKAAEAAQKAAEAAQAAALAASEAAASSTGETPPTPQQDTTATETPASVPEAALRGFIVQDGELYYYDETGNYVTGWFDKNNNRYCARDDGRLYKGGEHQIDSKKYLFDQGGVCLGEKKDDAWKQAYIDYIQQIHTKWLQTMDPELEGYKLIYVDNDDIPELVVKDDWLYYNVVSYANGTISADNEMGRFIEYIERGNLIHTGDGDSEGYNEGFYSIIDGKWTVVVWGEQVYYYDEKKTYYNWNGMDVSEEEYEREYKKVHNDKMKEVDPDCTYDQILDIIAGF